jgi:hypothetical protein
MLFNFLLILTFTNISFSFDKNFKTINDRVPLEFNRLFESLRDNISDQKEKIRLVNVCTEIDDNLLGIQKEHIFFLLKSEVIKNVVEHKHKKFSTYPITSGLIIDLEKDLKKKQSNLTPFSNWIWDSVIAELKFRESENLISEKKFDKNNFKGSQKLMAQRFERYTIFLLPWIFNMLNLDPEEFNKLTQKISWNILNKISLRSLLFKKLSSNSFNETQFKIFNIPPNLIELKTEDTVKMQSDVNSRTNSLSEESLVEKNKASLEIQNVSLDDLSPLSDEITKEIEQKSP